MKNEFRNTCACLVALFLLGCGTVNTVIRGDSVARYDLKQARTSCEAIPRVYSGVAYDMCILRGKPSRTALWFGSIPELIFIDLALSGALDTVALPYTIFGQINDGSIYLQ